jgi:hypothetical protein
MTFKIDQFYTDPTYGVVRFKGYKDGNLLFDRWEKSFVTSGRYSGWKEVGQRVNIDPRFQASRKIKSIPPPE